MTQLIIVIVIITVCVAYCLVHLVNIVRRPPSSCCGCSGCPKSNSRKRERRRGKPCCGEGECMGRGGCRADGK